LALERVHVAVIGGGAIGATLAYFLSRRGIRVTLFEKNEIGSGASFGNAGLLVPSYSTPLASYANMREGLRSLIGAPSAVHVKLRPGAETLAWVGRFLAAAQTARSERGLAALATLTQRSLRLYEEMLSSAPSTIAYARRGTMYVARSDATLRESMNLAKRLAAVGIRSEVMSGVQARAYEPTLSSAIAGAVWYPEEAKIHPLNFVHLMWDLALANGARIRQDSVTGIARDGRRAIGILTAHEQISADRVVLAAGSWSTTIGESIGLRVPILPAKGYSFDLKLARSPQTAMLF
jgi:D-amino-acid dehydrogenase